MVVLPGAGCPHQRQALPRLGAEGNVAQDPLFPFVGEPHPAELDGAVDALPGHGTAGRLRLGIHQLEDALGGGHGHLHGGVLLGEVADGHEEAGHVLQHRHQNAPGDFLAQHLADAVPQHQRYQGGAAHFHEGEVGRVVAGAHQAGVEVFVGALVKAGGRCAARS